MTTKSKENTETARSTKAAFAEVGSQVDFPKMESRVLQLWKDGKVFEKSVSTRPADREFIFNDGPPFATGLPHYGHLLASIIKDVVPRYWTMRGYRVERRFGWDCHGLPVENEAERELKLKTRQDIIAFGIGRFNEFCRELVMKYTSEWKQVINRCGRWVDWDNQYRTMDPEFMESVWWVFKSLWDKELIYEGFYSLAYCPRCATPLSNFEVNLGGYQDVQDPWVTVRLNVRGEENLSLLAWTTTPWTLPSNMGLAVGADIEYVRVRMKDSEQLVVAKARYEEVFKNHLEDVAQVTDQPVADLLEMTYDPLFDYFAEKRGEGAFRVVTADFVSTDEGTGIVHIAPGFGEDDYALGKEKGLPVVCPIDEDCAFTSEVGDYQGTFVKDADRALTRGLRESGHLLDAGTLMHSSPFCWRCDSPLIYRSIATWFVAIAPIKQKMLDANDQIWWVPEHIKGGRFGRWLEGARDWAISRNRYWGTPLPIWRNEETGEALCVGSREELEKLSGRKVEDLHKHYIDDIEIPSPTGRGVLTRVPEVLDCWFESGSMPYGQSHYPFENKERFEANFPPDFISEGLDQTRGWFYTLTILAAALFDKPAFKNCIVSGMLLAEDGRKMSKRLKNYPEPTEMLDVYGADALRLYLLNSPALRAEEMRMTEQGIKESLRSVLIPLWNAYSFFVTYARIDGWSPAAAENQAPANRLDRWILSELQTLLHDMNTEMTAYRLYRTVPAMVSFVEKLTNWYIRRSRRRFWKSEDDSDKAQAYATLYQVLVTFIKSLAPLLPFITEEIYQNLVRSFNADAEESVHLCEMPQADESLRDAELEEQMQLATLAVSLGRSLRSKHDLKVRQPLRRLYLLPPNEQSREELVAMQSMIADELNIKEIIIVEDETELADVSFKPNFRVLGPRFGKRMKEVASRVQSLTSDEIATLRDGGSVPAADGEITLDDLEVIRTEKDGLIVAVENNLGVALDTELDDELVEECTAREFVNRVQNMRRDSGLDVSDRIDLSVKGEPGLEGAVCNHRDYIMGETLAETLETGTLVSPCSLKQEWDVNGLKGTIGIRKCL
jgi:isoleucyl-tRNA synthetase